MNNVRLKKEDLPKGRIRKFVLLLAVLSVAALGALAWRAISRQAIEPVYNGKRLTQWIDFYEVNAHVLPRNPTMGAEEKAARKAIHAIGTNGFPILLEWACDHDSVLKLELRKFIIWTGTEKLTDLRLKASPDQYHELAIRAFDALGADGKPAVPALALLLKDRDMAVEITAMECLERIGPPAAEAVPALVNCLHETNNMVRFFAVRALGAIHAQPNLTVPALASYLDGLKQYHPRGHDPSSEQMTEIVLLTLKQYGPEARAAVQSLLPLLKDRNIHIRTMAFATLRAIDPDKANEEDMK